MDAPRLSKTRKEYILQSMLFLCTQDIRQACILYIGNTISFILQQVLNTQQNKVTNPEPLEISEVYRLGMSTICNMWLETKNTL